MAPASAPFYSTDLNLTNAVFLGNDSLSSRVISDFQNVRSGEFCHGVLFAKLICPVRNSVQKIVGVSVPAKVRQRIVGAVSVVVAALQASRFGATKCRQNEVMDSMRFANIVLPKTNRGARVFPATRARKYPLSALVSHAPKIRHLVDCFIIQYRQPFFHARMCGII